MLTLPFQHAQDGKGSVDGIPRGCSATAGSVTFSLSLSFSRVFEFIFEYLNAFFECMNLFSSIYESIFEHLNSFSSIWIHSLIHSRVYEFILEYMNSFSSIWIHSRVYEFILESIVAWIVVVGFLRKVRPDGLLLRQLHRLPSTVPEVGGWRWVRQELVDAGELQVQLPDLRIHLRTPTGSILDRQYIKIFEKKN
jgi:hypothetical protein